MMLAYSIQHIKGTIWCQDDSNNHHCYLFELRENWSPFFWAACGSFTPQPCSAREVWSSWRPCRGCGRSRGARSAGTPQCPPAPGWRPAPAARTGGCSPPRTCRTRSPSLRTAQWRIWPCHWCQSALPRRGCPRSWKLTSDPPQTTGDLEPNLPAAGQPGSPFSFSSWRDFSDENVILCQLYHFWRYGVRLRRKLTDLRRSAASPRSSRWGRNRRWTSSTLRTSPSTRRTCVQVSYFWPIYSILNSSLIGVILPNVDLFSLPVTMENFPCAMAWASLRPPRSARRWWRCRRWPGELEEGGVPVPGGASGEVPLHHDAAQQDHRHQVPGQPDLKHRNVTLLENLQLSQFYLNIFHYIIFKTEREKGSEWQFHMSSIQHSNSIFHYQ